MPEKPFPTYQKVVCVIGIIYLILAFSYVAAGEISYHLRESARTSLR
jgi:hypothetical protein